MSAGQMPPWLQEQLMKMQQSQQNLQVIMQQKQQIEMEKIETEKSLEELKKATGFALAIVDTAGYLEPPAE